VLKATPNPAHYVLARLALPSIRQRVAPDSELTHVTQNVDGFLTQALEEVATSHGISEPPSELIEMHGRLFDVVCTAHDCSFRETNYQSPICHALGGTERIVEEGTTDPVVRRADLPHCPLCGQLCRPGVVWFGERPHRIQDILDLANKADLCIIVGTSAEVRVVFLPRPVRLVN
jgi:NAD-dependent deacetylase sirtuin 5